MAECDIHIVIGDVEKFVGRLLFQVKQDNCTHSISDLLDEFFNNKIASGSLAEQYTSQQSDQPLRRGDRLT